MIPTLYNQCRSGPSYRVRIALNIKGVEFAYVAVNLRSDAQKSARYRAINGQGMVPSLKLGDRVLTQSGAIIEWLEETYPSPPLLPRSNDDRAIVRAMAAIIGSDIQPLNNLRTQEQVRTLGAGDTELRAWTHRWIDEGLSALNGLVLRHGGEFCFGDTFSMADVYLVPQAATAETMGFDLTSYPRLAEIVAHANALAPFAAASPRRQPDWT